MFQIFSLSVVTIVILSLVQVILLICVKNNDELSKKSKSIFFNNLLYIIICSAWCALMTIHSYTPPKIIETNTRPLVDTNIMIIDAVPDTSYIYTFHNFFVD